MTGSRFGRRALLQGAASALLVGGIAPAYAAGSLTSLRSTAKSWLWAPEDFAIASGLFDRSGLKVEMAATLRGVNQDALLGGACDVLLGAATQNMRVQIRRQPVKMICGFVNKFASNVVISKALADRAGITEASPVAAKAAVLRGLRLGTTGAGAAPDQLLRYLMGKAGIDPDKDALLVPITGGGAAMLAALHNAKIDGFCLSSPTSDVAVEKFGATYLFNMTTNPPPELADYLYITASCTEKTLKARGPELVAYCKGLALALTAIDRKPDDFKTWARSWFGDMEPTLLEIAYANNVGMYMKTPVPTAAQFALNLEFLARELQAGGQPGVPPGFGFADAFDLRPLEQAMATL
jgi:ABC-type nitrate/sulfonate/bicarbonate transport system substrate-binding protein